MITHTTLTFGEKDWSGQVEGPTTGHHPGSIPLELTAQVLHHHQPLLAPSHDHNGFLMSERKDRAEKPLEQMVVAKRAKGHYNGNHPPA